jgi:hypothetical protein
MLTVLHAGVLTHEPQLQVYPLALLQPLAVLLECADGMPRTMFISA